MVHTYSHMREGDNKLTPHFRVRDFRCRDGTDTILIDDWLPLLLEKLYAKLDDWGYGVDAIIVNSGYRTGSYDRSVGGHGQHTTGKAADINVRINNICPLSQKRGDRYYLTADLLCCALQAVGASGIGYMGGIAAHCDVREDPYWKDHTTDKVVSDWFAYFGMKNPDEGLSSPLLSPL